MIKIILNLGGGSLIDGCSTVIGEVLASQSLAAPRRFTGQLPAAPALAIALAQWQQLYYACHQDLTLRIQLLQQSGLSYSDARFRELCSHLDTQLNQWLDTPEFRPIDRILRRELARCDSAQIILETQETQLQKLPWHLWKIFEEYPNAELSFSTGNWNEVPSRPTASKQSRILATLGHGSDLDLTSDLEALNRLPKANLTVLNAPSLNQLHEKLWQPEGWDIFFFAGHSQTQKTIGMLNLNEQESLTIEQLKHTLSKAIEQGLKVAIFNSCDGLGLAQQLSDLQIPYVVVMREPVPDEVARQFVHYLLAAFAAGCPIHLAVREARQRLTGLENEIPGASWLPIIWQNPTATAIYWKDLQPPACSPSPVPQTRRRWRSPLVTGLLTGGVVLAMRALGVLEPVELAAYDRLIRQRPIEPIDSRIVTVEISEETTSTYGYPLPDEMLTALIEKVNQAEPLAVGLDIHRAKPRPAVDLAKDLALVKNTPALAASFEGKDTGYTRFLQQVEDNPNLFLVCSYGSRDENYQVPQQLSESVRSEQVGFSDLPVDIDRSKMKPFSIGHSALPKVNAGLTSAMSGAVSGATPEVVSGVASGAIVRRHLLSYDPTFSLTPSNCATPYSFSFQLAYQYLYEKGIAPLVVTEDEHWQFGEVVLQSLSQRFGGYQHLETPSSQLLLNYRANQPAQKISFEQLFSSSFNPQIMRDRVVLIGYNAPVAKDYFDTPYGPMPGTWVHAHMVSQLLGAVLDDRPLIQGLPQWRSFQWGDMVWILVWSGLGGYACCVSKRPLPWLLSLSAMLLLLYGTCWLALIYGLWLPLVPTSLAVMGSAVMGSTAITGLRPKHD